MKTNLDRTGVAAMFLCALFFVIVVPKTNAATITVDRTDDTASASACTAAANDCSLRGALAYADAHSGTTINVPAGTYHLTIDELRVGTATNVLTTITGAGANVTEIHQTLSNRRVLELNPAVSANVVVVIAGLKFTGGNSPSDGFGGGALLGGGAGNRLDLSNCIFDGNYDDPAAYSPNGGAVEWSGGGVLNVDSCTFNNNRAGSATGNGVGNGEGGALRYQLLNNAGASGQGGLTVTNSTFTNNKAGLTNTTGAGGAICVIVTTDQTPRTVSITHNTFSGNQANALNNGHGGALTNKGSKAITVKYNRFFNNTATGEASGVHQPTGTVGTIDATQNWWGCNAGPGNAGCDSMGGATANITTNPRIVLSHTPAASSLIAGQATTLTASFLSDSANNVLTTANIARLIGLPITFNNAVRGALSGAPTTIQANGTATATFTSNAAGAGSADAVVDNQTVTASLTINRAGTTTTITTHTPDPSTPGQAVTVQYTVTSSYSGTPTGNVTVSDSVDSCTASVAAGQCTLTLTTTGARTLTAVYAGDTTYNNGTSAGVSHTVSSGCATLAFNSLPSGAVGATYGQLAATVTPTNGYAFSVSFGSLPPGVSLDTTYGLLYGTPATAGLYNFKLKATPPGSCGAAVEQAFTLQVVCPTITLSPNGASPTVLPAGNAGMSYRTTMSATASPTGMATFTYSIVSGALPSGLSLNATTGEIRGTTNFVGTSNFTMRATGSGGCFGQQAYRLVTNCPVIALGFAANPVTPNVPVVLANGVVGTAYNKALAASPTGTTYLYSRITTSGALPSGLSLNAMTGALTGTPTTAGTYNFEIRAQGFGACAGTQKYTVTIQPLP